MSKELVVTPKNEIVFTKQAGDVISAEELFVPAVDTKWFDEMVYFSEAHHTETIVLSSLITNTAAVFFGMPTIKDAVLSNDVFGSLGLAGLLASVTIGLPIALIVGIKRSTKLPKLLVKKSSEYNEKALTLWLQARYSIIISDETARFVMSYISSYQKDIKSIVFLDVNETHFRLDRNDKMEFFVIELQDNKLTEDYVATVIEEKVGSSNLDGEAATLCESVVTRLATLRKRDLSVEANHIVSRVSNDLKQVLDLNDELKNLDSSNSVAVVRILSSLNSELHDLLGSEVFSVNSQLEVQARYVEARKMKTLGSSDANLNLGYSAEVDNSEPDLISSVESAMIDNELVRKDH